MVSLNWFFLKKKKHWFETLFLENCWKNKNFRFLKKKVRKLTLLGCPFSQSLSFEFCGNLLFGRFLWEKFASKCKTTTLARTTIQSPFFFLPGWYTQEISYKRFAIIRSTFSLQSLYEFAWTWMSFCMNCMSVWCTKFVE